MNYNNRSLRVMSLIIALASVLAAEAGSATPNLRSVVVTPTSSSISVGQAALAQAIYRITPLGYLGGCTKASPVAYGFNATDEVTGQACNAHGDMHAFVWKNDGHPMADLGPKEVGSTSLGNAINASGLVAGYGQDSTGQFGFVSSGDGTPMTKIPDGLGGTVTGAFAVNNAGQVTGFAEAKDSTYHAMLWKNDGSPMRDLGVLAAQGFFYVDGTAINESAQVAATASLGFAPGSLAAVWKNNGTPLQSLGVLSGGANSWDCCINSSGQVAGSSNKGGTETTRAFLWTNDGKGMENLGTLGGTVSIANALNDSGQVTGWSDTVGAHKSHAFVWMNDGTPMKDLGTLGGTASAANDINSSGQVTGWANTGGTTVKHAFLWRNDGTRMKDLNKLVDPTDPLHPYVTLTSGDFINARGDVVAEGIDSRTRLAGVYLLKAARNSASMRPRHPAGVASPTPRSTPR